MASDYRRAVGTLHGSPRRACKRSPRRVHYPTPLPTGTRAAPPRLVARGALAAARAHTGLFHRVAACPCARYGAGAAGRATCLESPSGAGLVALHASAHLGAPPASNPPAARYGLGELDEISACDDSTDGIVHQHVWYLVVTSPVSHVPRPRARRRRMRAHVRASPPLMCSVGCLTRAVVPRVRCFRTKSDRR